jgi:hypothetical protein
MTTTAHLKKNKDNITTPKSKNIKEGQLDNEASKNGESGDDRVECHKCLRKFDVNRIDKHITTCKPLNAHPLSCTEHKNKDIQ